jgi:amino acid adenylation domain-containing protein
LTSASHDDLGARLGTLTPAQRALLERRLLERRASAAKLNRVERREVTSPCPLSYSQELLWLLSQVFNDGVAYNAPGAYRLQGPLDLDLLRRALDALVDRHEILRTTYSVVDDHPMQVIHEHLSVELNVIDLSGRPHDEQQAETSRILHEESVFPFDLVNGPVMRPTVIRHRADDHVFMLVLHHIATDGYSRAVIYHDLTALYDSLAAGIPSPLPPLPIQYADYAVWHRRWLDDGAARNQLDYWKTKLAGAPSRLDLPADYARPPRRSYAGDFRTQMLDLSWREGLRAVARAEEATLFVALVSLFGVLLGRYASQDDLVVGTPFAGRNRSEFEQMVGYFINPLALRLDLHGDPSFSELLARTRGTVLEAFANADLPFETVVRETNPTRDLSQTPVFQSMIVLHNPDWETKRPKFEPERIRATELTYEKGWAKFDVLLGMSERTAGLNTTWEYGTELFNRSTIEQMMRHFRQLGESAIAHPERAVSRLSMLSDDERGTVLGWRGTHQLPGQQGSIKELFERQAARTPNAPAVVFKGERLTFGELNRDANHLAWRLKELGVGPGTFVGIMMNKSLELVPAVLAVMKAGGAYIPLDPQYPRSRIEFMLKDARPHVVLTHPELLDQVDGSGPTLVAVDGIADGRDDDPPTTAAGDDLAYVIYTSGSTGLPKGAMITNRSLASAYFAYERAYRLRELTAHAQMASFSFDVFTADLIRSLCAGAKLILCPLDTVIDPAALYELMLAESIDAAEFVPATASMLFDYAERECKTLDQMRLVVVSSEAWRNDKYEFFKRLCGPRTRLINAYGLTEATIDSTWFEPTEESELVPGRFVPIGRPLDNTQVYILDSALEPRPVGIPGELCVGGIAVARGYLNRPELTAERFVPDPFTNEPGALLYRTGDLARWLPDGTIDFLGRFDRQIKIRGFRIEPGEIEAALERRPEIRTAAVAERRDPRGETRLVGYIETDGSTPDPGDLRAFLSEHVPSYMIPSAYVRVGALPVTPNGKIDLDALPEPEWKLAAAAEAFVAPRNETETRLAAVWSAVLGIAEIGIHDSFFELGGHSLMAVQLFAQIERKLGVRLPLSALFESATIAGLAELIENERGRETVWPSIVEMRRGKEGKAPFFLTAFAGGDLIPYRELVESLDSGLPVFGLIPPGVDRRARTLATVEELAAHYVEEMRRVQPHGPYRIGGFCFSGVVAYEMARQLQARGESISMLALIDAYPHGRGHRRGLFEAVRAQSNAFRAADRAGRQAWLRDRMIGIRNRLRYAVHARVGPRIYAMLADRKLDHLIPHRPWNLVWIATNAAKMRYVPTPSDVRVAFFRAQRRPANTSDTPWDRFAARGVDLRPIIGPSIDHEGILREPHVHVLAAQLMRDLDEGAHTTAPLLVTSRRAPDRADRR